MTISGNKKMMLILFVSERLVKSTKKETNKKTRKKINNE